MCVARVGASTFLKYWRSMLISLNHFQPADLNHTCEPWGGYAYTFFGWAVCKPWFFWFLLQGLLHSTWVVRQRR